MSIIVDGIMEAAKLDEEMGGSYALRMYSGGGGGGNWLRMSKLGKCVRALAYEKLGVEHPPLDASSLFNFRLGRMLESDMVYLLKLAIRKRLFPMTEVRLTNTGATQREVMLDIPTDGPLLRVKGHCDGVIMVNGEKAILEIKSIGNYMYREFIGKGPDVLSREWTVQKHCYMVASGIGKHRMLLVCKDMTRLRGVPRVSEVISEPDRSIVDAAAARAKLVAACTSLSDVPDREFDAPDKFPCSFCDYRSPCWHL